MGIDIDDAMRSVFCMGIKRSIPAQTSSRSFGVAIGRRRACLMAVQRGRERPHPKPLPQ